MNFPVLSKIVEDKNNNLWICTEGGGLNIYDISKDKFKHITPTTDAKFPSNIIVTAQKYNEALIILTKRGVCKMNLDTETIEPFFEDLQTELKIGYHLTNLYIDSDDNMWLSLAKGGLIRYDIKNKSIRNYIHSTNGSGTITHNPISYIYETTNNKLLFSSHGSGLYEYDKEKDCFKHHSMEDKCFLSNFIYYISETNNGYILILTNQGVNLLDKGELRSMYSLTQNNGFPLDKINFDCGACVTRNGEIFIAGANGMASFFETRINNIKKSYHLSFSDLYVNNILQNVQSQSKIISVSFPFANKIRLNHKQTNFMINFASSNYVKSNQIPFEYKLIGVDDNWIPLSGQTISYSNLSPGDYTLTVREQRYNNSNRGFSNEISLEIQVSPPFYTSIGAYLTYLIVLCSVLWFIIYTYKSKFKLKTSLEYEIRENNRIQELNQTKLQFFTNISHEFRTPLILIIGQLESLIQIENLQNNVKNRLSKIHKSSSHLLFLISELLDFRKQENSSLRVKVCEVEIVEFCRSICTSFNDLAAKKQIDYSFSSSVSNINIWLDPKQIQKVFYNLLSNAFKYTESGESIIFKIVTHSEFILIEVVDSGIGVSKEDMPHIFEQFYQGRTKIGEYYHNPGTGIGLALSKNIVELHHGERAASKNVEKGSTFRVKLFLGNNHFSPEEKSEKDLDISNYSMPEQSFFKEISSYTESSSSETTILIIEDDEDILDLLVDVFSPLYRVETAKDGYEGIAKVKIIQPDIILSDIMMPNMSGREMCVKLKSNFETSHIPIILITADVSIEQNIGGLKSGATLSLILCK